MTHPPLEHENSIAVSVLIDDLSSILIALDSELPSPHDFLGAVRSALHIADLGDVYGVGILD